MILASMDCESTCQGRTALCRSDTWSQIFFKASAATRPTRCGRYTGTGLGRQAAPHPSTSTGTIPDLGDSPHLPLSDRLGVIPTALAATVAIAVIGETL